MSRSVTEAGVSGRGGGLPGRAQRATAGRGSRRAVVVVNAMEGEPASIKDRILCVACPAPGPRRGRRGLLDDRRISGGGVCSGPSRRRRRGRPSGPRRTAEGGHAGHPVSVERPPGRYVAGEESALVGWLERHRPLPTLRVDKSVSLTVGRRAVLVHNAETLAQVALIARHGPQWFRQCGTVEAPGTTLVTVTGGDRLPLLMEVEFGCPVAEILGRAGIDPPLNGALIGGYGRRLARSGTSVHALRPWTLGRLRGPLSGSAWWLPFPAPRAASPRRPGWRGDMAGESAGQCGPCVFGFPPVAADLVDLPRDGRRRPGGPDGEAVGPDRRARGLSASGWVVRLVRSALEVFADDVRAHRDGHPCPASRAPTVMTLPTGGSWPA